MVDHDARFKVLEWEIASLRQALALALHAIERGAAISGRDDLAKIRQGLDKPNPHLAQNPTPGECHFCGKETTGLIHGPMGVVFSCPEPCVFNDD